MSSGYPSRLRSNRPVDQHSKVVQVLPLGLFRPPPPVGYTDAGGVGRVESPWHEDDSEGSKEAEVGLMSEEGGYFIIVKVKFICRVGWLGVITTTTNWWSKHWDAEFWGSYWKLHTPPFSIGNLLLELGVLPWGVFSGNATRRKVMTTQTLQFKNSLNQLPDIYHPSWASLL